jgi:hypothetical protein
MSQMMQGGAPGAQAGPPAPAQSAAQSGSYASSSDPAAQLFAKACDLIAAGITQEPDPQAKAQAAKVLAMCHALVGKLDSQNDSALGMSPALKMVQRATAARAAGVGG